MNREKLISLVNGNFTLPKWDHEHRPLMYRVEVNRAYKELNIRGYSFHVSQLSGTRLALTQGTDEIWLGAYELLFGPQPDKPDLDRNRLWAVSERINPSDVLHLTSFYYHLTKRVVNVTMRLSDDLFKK